MICCMYELLQLLQFSLTIVLITKQLNNSTHDLLYVLPSALRHIQSPRQPIEDGSVMRNCIYTVGDEDK